MVSTSCHDVHGSKKVEQNEWTSHSLITKRRELKEQENVNWTRRSKVRNRKSTEQVRVIKKSKKDEESLIQALAE